jgi:NCAIR mutase (PurE)-related protein
VVGAGRLHPVKELTHKEITVENATAQISHRTYAVKEEVKWVSMFRMCVSGLAGLVGGKSQAQAEAHLTTAVRLLELKSA